MPLDLHFHVAHPKSSIPRLRETDEIVGVIPELGTLAKRLLSEASRDKNGVVMKILVMEGLRIETNGRNLNEAAGPRAQAQWADALGQLIEAGLLEDRARNDEIFYVTDAGFELADALSLSEQSAVPGSE